MMRGGSGGGEIWLRAGDAAAMADTATNDRMAFTESPGGSWTNDSGQILQMACGGPAGAPRCLQRRDRAGEAAALLQFYNEIL